MAVIASLLLVVSVFFDYSFLLAIGLSFDEIPSSLSEHVRSAILWAPKVLLTALAFFIRVIPSEGGRRKVRRRTYCEFANAPVYTGIPKVRRLGCPRCRLTCSLGWTIPIQRPTVGLPALYPAVGVSCVIGNQSPSLGSFAFGPTRSTVRHDPNTAFYGWTSRLSIWYSYAHNGNAEMGDGSP